MLPNKKRRIGEVEIIRSSSLPSRSIYDAEKMVEDQNTVLSEADIHQWMNDWISGRPPVSQTQIKDDKDDAAKRLALIEVISDQFYNELVQKGEGLILHALMAQRVITNRVDKMAAINREENEIFSTVKNHRVEKKR